MIDRSVIFTLIASIVSLLFVLELVRRRKLREDYSLLWLGTAFVMFVLSIWRDLLHSVSRFVGVTYPPNLLFLVALLFILFLLLYFSTVITRLTQENREIAQQVALLRYELQQVQSTAKEKDTKEQ